MLLRVGARQRQMPGDPALTTAAEEQVEKVVGAVGVLDPNGQFEAVRQPPGQAGRA
ncbi:hypothetical protein [Streptomyces sp. 11x1]|uniref:hypothetical protein n=1 Tax=Streptomyces sp. 11x1 TaxID=3038642 RepID=UPI00292EFF86|nr:hypothetical protein [Streptomyces sp. 11x1]WNZ06553.1 hypothetical protein P8T65_02420 [Streptomyces sp. 11x1]